MYSHEVLKRFVKDHSIPIQVLREPYFKYFMELYNDQYKTREKFELLKAAIKQSGSEESFLNEYYKISDKIVTAIHGLEIYKEYNSMKMDNYNIPKDVVYPTHNIFSEANVGKYFVSIDLEKANFQALKYFNKELVLSCNTYEEFVSMFTDLDYMKESKYLRQVIFGHMNPKRQAKIEKYITYQILKYIINNNIIKSEWIRMFSNDEIVFEVEFSLAHEAFAKLDLTRLIKDKLGFDVDIEVYKLLKIPNQQFFVKKFINKSGYELTCVPLIYHSQVFKAYNNKEIEDNDLVFFYENQICKFMKPLDFNGREGK